MTQPRMREGVTVVTIVAIVFVISTAVTYALRDGSTANGAAAATVPSGGGWLLSAPNDAERFRLVQQQFGGFDRSMSEVGERFRRVHEALQRRNFELAEYHWDKIGSTIASGIVRRPKRAANARVMFLGENFEAIGAAFEKHDYGTAAAAFERAKGVCAACHQAENVAWVNDQPLFELTLPVQVAAGEQRK